MVFERLRWPSVDFRECIHHSKFAEIEPRRNRNGEGNCIKRHTKIVVFLSKFERKFNHKNGYAVGNCITQHAKIDDDSRFANFAFVFIRCEGRTWIFSHLLPTRKLRFFERLFDGCLSIARADRLFKRSFQQLVLINIIIPKT